MLNNCTAAWQAEHRSKSKSDLSFVLCQFLLKDSPSFASEVFCSEWERFKSFLVVVLISGLRRQLHLGNPYISTTKWVQVDTGFKPGATGWEGERHLCAMRPPQKDSNLYFDSFWFDLVICLITSQHLLGALRSKIRQKFCMSWIRTQEAWVTSTNATSVLCCPP